MTWRTRGPGFGALECGAGFEMLLWWGDGRARAAWLWYPDAAIVWIDVASA